MSDFPSWISALTAVGALVAAVWAGLTAKRLYVIESHRDEDQAFLRRSAAAQLVSAWPAVLLKSEGTTKSFGLVIFNGGSTPRL